MILKNQSVTIRKLYQCYNFNIIIPLSSLGTLSMHHGNNKITKPPFTSITTIIIIIIMINNNFNNEMKKREKKKKRAREIASTLLDGVTRRQRVRSCTYNTHWTMGRYHTLNHGADTTHWTCGKLPHIEPVGGNSASSESTSWILNYKPNPKLCKEAFFRGCNDFITFIKKYLLSTVLSLFNLVYSWVRNTGISMRLEDFHG